MFLLLVARFARHTLNTALNDFLRTLYSLRSIYIMELGLNEEVYQIVEKPIYQTTRKLNVCSLCRYIIEDRKYLCVVIAGYDIRDYYHTGCYKKALQLENLYGNYI